MSDDVSNVLKSYGYKKTQGKHALMLSYQKRDDKGPNHNVDIDYSGGNVNWQHHSTLGDNNPTPATKGSSHKELYSHLRKVHGSSQHAEELEPEGIKKKPPIARPYKGGVRKKSVEDDQFTEANDSQFGEFSDLKDHHKLLKSHGWKPYIHKLTGLVYRHPEKEDEHIEMLEGGGFRHTKGHIVEPDWRKEKKGEGKNLQDLKNHFSKSSQHTEVQASNAPMLLGGLGPCVQFREEPNQQFSEEDDSDKSHQHIMGRLGYKHYRNGSYFHGPSSGAKNVMKDAKSGTYQFLNGHNSSHNKWGMNKKELYEHLDHVHGGFQSLTRKTPHEAAKE